MPLRERQEIQEMLWRLSAAWQVNPTRVSHAKALTLPYILRLQANSI
jgi:hypothetical protein